MSRLLLTGPTLSSSSYVHISIHLSAKPLWRAPVLVTEPPSLEELGAWWQAPINMMCKYEVKGMGAMDTYQGSEPREQKFGGRRTRDLG